MFKWRMPWVQGHKSEPHFEVRQARPGKQKQRTSMRRFKEGWLSRSVAVQGSLRPDLSANSP